MVSPIEQHLHGFPEKIPARITEAVKFIPVDEYIKLRHQKARFCEADEYKQMSDAVDVLQNVAGKLGKIYKLDDEVKFSADPRVIIARQVVKNISTPIYLATRRKVLNAAINSSIRRRNEYELLGAAEVEKENDKLQRRLADLNLTNAVIAAAKVNLSSAA
ncbi:MAG: hypothetical protein NT149_02665 [Candidatus Gottesmanbacteria bacterium]|nr:hypothetical protein [Candidatus Gottesmanbacteria bacterium]